MADELQHHDAYGPRGGAGDRERRREPRGYEQEHQEPARADEGPMRGAIPEDRPLYERLSPSNVRSIIGLVVAFGAALASFTIAQWQLANHAEQLATEAAQRRAHDDRTDATLRVHDSLLIVIGYERAHGLFLTRPHEAGTRTAQTPPAAPRNLFATRRHGDTLAAGALHTIASERALSWSVFLDTFVAPIDNLRTSWTTYTELATVRRADTSRRGDGAP